MQASARYLRISPKKVKDLVSTIVNLRVEKALSLLSSIPRKSARELKKVLASAVANAENNLNVSAASLFVERASVDQGPRLKRFMPKARGSAHAIQKRMSHISVFLKEES